MQADFDAALNDPAKRLDRLAETGLVRQQDAAVGLVGQERGTHTLVGPRVHRHGQPGQDLVKAVQLGVGQLAQVAHRLLFGDGLPGPCGQPLADDQHVGEDVAHVAAGLERHRVCPTALGL